MSLNNLGVGIILSAKDMASSVIGRVRESFSQLEGTTKEAKASFDAQVAGFMQGAAMMGVGVMGLRTAFGMAEAAAPFDEALGRASWRTQATTAELDKMKEAAVAASNELRVFSETQAMNTLAKLTEGGNSANESIEMLVPTLKLARVAMMEGGQAADYLDNLLDVWGMDASETSRRVDQLAWAQRRFGISVGDMSPLMGRLAASAKNAGASFEDVLLIFGLTRSIAGPREAIMATNVALQQLTSENFAGKLQEQFAGMEVQVGGRFKSLSELLPEIAQRMQGMSEAQRGAALTAIFGNRAAGGLAMVMDKLATGIRDSTGATVTGGEAIRALSGEMLNATGEVDDAIERESDYKTATDAASAAWNDLKRSVGESFLPMLSRALEGITGLVDGLTAGWRSLSPWTQTCITGFFTMASSLFVLGGAIKMVTAVWGILKTAMTLGLLGKAGGAGVAGAGPIGWVIGALMLLVWWIGYVYEHWQDFYAFWDWIAQKIFDKWNEVVDGFWNTVARIREFIGSVIDELKALWEDPIAYAKEKWGAFVDWVKGIPTAIWDALKSIGERIKKFIMVDVPLYFWKATQSATDAILAIPGVGGVLETLGVEGTSQLEVAKKEAEYLRAAGLEIPQELQEQIAGARAFEPTGGRYQGTMMAAPAWALSPSPAAAAAEGQTAAVTAAVRAAIPPPAPVRPPPPVNQTFVVQIDGAPVAAAVVRQQNEAAARGFSQPPLPEAI